MLPARRAGKGSLPAHHLYSREAACLPLPHRKRWSRDEACLPLPHRKRRSRDEACLPLPHRKRWSRDEACLPLPHRNLLDSIAGWLALRLNRTLVAQHGLNHKEKLLETERFAQKQARMQAHALQFPVIAARDQDNGCISCVIMPAQDPVERDAVQIWQPDIQQNQVCAQFWQVILGVL